MKADANRDGYVDRAEYQLSGDCQFSHLDPDHHGAVPISDLPRLARSSAPQAKRLKILLHSADRDHDTTVTRAEFVKARSPVWDRLDQDRNGRPSRKEVKGARSRLETPR
ncbi:EF-hand domain-containing protein [Caulobacter sp. UNC358MFTsu5.1]|uniref:EF-hand domain-containing protein n=1 Tax=Caulobacter sp. UNC358MFTsu5.1 TaxID=1449049 RepID=UPI0012DEEAF7|nr:EF-hand domain-containing protein [Caulobacter sp. UNC358MFTsu5.1]